MCYVKQWGVRPPVLQGLCSPTFRLGVLPSSSLVEVPKHTRVERCKKSHFCRKYRLSKMQALGSGETPRTTNSATQWPLPEHGSPKSRMSRFLHGIMKLNSFRLSVSHRMLKVRHQQPTYNAVLYPLVVAVRPSTAQFLRQLRHFDVLVQSAEWNVDRLENKQAGPVNTWRAGRILCGEWRRDRPYRAAEPWCVHLQEALSKTVTTSFARRLHCASVLLWEHHIAHTIVACEDTLHMATHRPQIDSECRPLQRSLVFRCHKTVWIS